MAKIKGLKKLNKTITAQFSRFGISSITCSDEYAYHFDDESITFKITEDIEDEWFTEFIKERFDYEVQYPFVISILHEVGHHKTGDDIVDSVYQFCIDEKERIDEEMSTEDDPISKELEWQYFNLPDEIMATQWAVNYAKKHPRIIKKMWDEIQKAFSDFYTKNNVTDD